MGDLIALVQFAVGFAILGYAIADTIRVRKVKVFLLFLAYFSIAYFITPAAQYFFPYSMGAEASSGRLYTEANYLQSTIYVLVGLCAACCAYYVGRRSGRRFAYDNSAVEMRRYSLDQRFVISAAAICLLFCVLYSSQYGGIYSALTFGGKIRAGAGDELMQGSGYLLFIKYLLPIGAIGVLVLVHQCVRTESRLTTAGIVWIAAVLGIALLALLLMSGRNRIVALGVAVVVVLFNARREPINLSAKKLVGGGGAAAFAYLFIMYGKVAWSVLAMDSPLSEFADRVSQLDASPLYFLRNFEHQFVSVDASIGYLNGGGDYRFFVDVYNAPIAVVPTWVLGGDKPEPISVLNTYMMVARHDSQVPPGLIGFGIYSLGIVGVIATMIVYGLALRYVDSKLLNPENFSAVHAWTAMVLLVQGTTGDPRVLMYALLPVFFALGLRFLLRKRIVLR